MNQLSASSDGLALVADLAVQAAKANIYNAHRPALLHDGKAVSLERFEKLRATPRGKFNTTVLSGFADYLKRREFKESANLFADPKALNATAYFDSFAAAGTQGHCEDTARLGMAKTAAYEALCQLNGCKLGQAKIVDFLVDWKSYLSDASVIQKFMSLKLRKVSEKDSAITNVSARRTALEEIAASSAGGEIPEYISFWVTPYLGFLGRRFEVTVVIDPQSESPVFAFRVVGLEQIQEEIGVEFAALIQSETGFSPCLGNFDGLVTQ